MYYLEAGSGELLLLSMGFGGDHTAWAFQIGALSARYRVIAFDNRGVGRTDAPDHPYTTGMMARDSLGLMDALGIDRVHVIGVSMGGMIAHEPALAHPERVTLHLQAEDSLGGKVEDSYPIHRRLCPMQLAGDGRCRQGRFQIQSRIGWRLYQRLDFQIPGGSRRWQDSS